MAVGPLFTISAINVARAAVREVERGISVDFPVDISIGSCDPARTSQLYIEVVAREGGTRLIEVDDAAVDVCLAEDDHETTHRRVNELIDALAGEIRAAATELTS